jgi:hypothetical protein
VAVSIPNLEYLDGQPMHVLVMTKTDGLTEESGPLQDMATRQAVGGAPSDDHSPPVVSSRGAGGGVWALTDRLFMSSVDLNSPSEVTGNDKVSIIAVGQLGDTD